MNVETVAGLVAPDVDAHAERSALWAGGGPTTPERRYDYARLRTDAQKTGNLFALQGVRDGRRLGVADDRAPEVALALLGAALVGGVVRYAPPQNFDGRAVLVPVDRAADYDLPPGGRRIAYGGAPADPATVHFEEEVWSENPTTPPPRVAPEDLLLSTADAEVSHGAVVDAARRTVEDAALDGESVVAVRASLADPGVVAAGLVAPLLAGATVLLPGEDEVGTHAVVADADRTTAEDERIVADRL